MTKIVFALSAAVLAAIVVPAVSGQDWDRKTIEKMLADGTKKLSSANADERETGAGYILGYIRCSDKQKYLPVLTKALQDANPKVRKTVVQTFEKLQASEAIPDLVPLLMDPDSDVAERTAYTLGGLGAAGKSAIPALQKAQAAYKAQRKSMLEGTMQEGIDEINGKSKGNRYTCPEK
jgi:HEAT repeat protein